MPSVKERYETELSTRRSDTGRFRRIEDRIANGRLVVAVVAAAMLWPILGSPGISGWWLLAPAAAFVGLVVYHERVIRRRDLSLRSEAFFQRGIDRLTGAWPGRGEQGERYRDPDHPYAADLDLFGEGSLFELLCTARTRAGEDTLAGWLTSPSPAEDLKARHEAVAELTPRLDLREEIELFGGDIPFRESVESVRAWGAAPEVELSRALRPTAILLAVLGIVGLVLWIATSVGPTPFAAAVILDALLVARTRGQVAAVCHGAERPAREIDLFATLLERIERETFQAPLLAELGGRLAGDGTPPSEHVRKLLRLSRLLDAMKNQLFYPFGFLLLWDVQLAVAIEGYRRQWGGRLAGWLGSVGEIEALLALASHSFEHPGDPFPEIAEEAPVLAAEGLGHPLLDEKVCIPNDVSLGEGLQLLVVSGSNMSGKSTLLRAVGTNAVLALAGAPVRATSLRISPLTIGASIRVEDSLLGGSSRFYAEITRLKHIVDLTQEGPPVLFLLDELLNGTNSHDRTEGARGLLEGLVAKGAVGLVTTHDLALAAIAESLGDRAANVHFEDHMEDGRMVFDYRLRAGTVKKSNALELMRAVGLDV